MDNQLINAQQMAQTVGNLPEVVGYVQGIHDRGVAAGNSILDKIEQEGMSAETYAQCQDYIRRANASQAKMKETRSPLTQLMDSVRKQFTTLEADFDAKNKDSVVGQIQAHMNTYAAEQKRIREEEERKRQNEALKGQLTERYKSEIRKYLDERLAFIKTKCDAKLKQYWDAIELSNIEEMQYNIQNVVEDLSDAQIAGNVMAAVAIPEGMEGGAFAEMIAGAVITEKLAMLKAEIKAYVHARKQYYLDIIPNKKEALETALIDEAEAKKKAEELKRYEAEEAERLRLQNDEAEAKKKAEEALKMQQAQANVLFNAVPQVPETPVKAKSKYAVEILNANGFAAVFNFWWVNEGASMSVEDLLKATAKKMITYAEKRANAKEPEFINDSNVLYKEEITAK